MADYFSLIDRWRWSLGPRLNISVTSLVTCHITWMGISMCMCCQVKTTACGYSYLKHSFECNSVGWHVCLQKCEKCSLGFFLILASITHGSQWNLVCTPVISYLQTSKNSTCRLRKMHSSLWKSSTAMVSGVWGWTEAWDLIKDQNLKTYSTRNDVNCCISTVHECFVPLWEDTVTWMICHWSMNCRGGKIHRLV